MRRILVALILFAVLLAPGSVVSFDADEEPYWSEMFGETHPLDGDSDNDGLTDTEELEGPTDPLVADTDGDGLKDGREMEIGSNPTNVDTDGDGLSDSSEAKKYDTDPTAVDTDNDGVNDPVEVRRGTDPAIAADCSAFSSSTDSDGDGLSDKKECRVGTNPESADTDGDGLSDAEELSGETKTGVPIKNSNPNHMDLYLHIVVTDGTNIDKQIIEQEFDDMGVSNPSGRDGIDVHVRTTQVNDTVVFSGEDSYYDIRSKYMDDYDVDDQGVYKTVMIVQDDSDSYAGYGTIGGDFSVVASGDELIAVHEILHNIVGHVKSQSCDDGHHVCGENGYLSSTVKYGEDDMLSDTVRKQIEQRGIKTKETE